MRRLPNNVSRCWDEKCIHRSRCLRSLGRYDDGARDFILTCQGLEGEDKMPYPLLIPLEKESNEPPL